MAWEQIPQNSIGRFNVKPMFTLLKLAILSPQRGICTRRLPTGKPCHLYRTRTLFPLSARFTFGRCKFEHAVSAIEVQSKSTFGTAIYKVESFR